MITSSAHLLSRFSTGQRVIFKRLVVVMVMMMTRMRMTKMNRRAHRCRGRRRVMISWAVERITVGNKKEGAGTAKIRTT